MINRNNPQSVLIDATHLGTRTHRTTHVKPRRTFIFVFALPADHRRTTHGETFPSGRLEAKCTPSHFHGRVFTGIDPLRMSSV